MFISNGKKPLHIARKHISHSASATRPTTHPHTTMTLIEREKETIGIMIRLYCHRKLHAEAIPDEYAELLDYAHARLDRCRFGNQKTSCKHCPIHCYAREKRILMKEVMRWCGPRMLFYHPIIALRHLLRR